MEEIRKYAGIINEDSAEGYATALDKYLCDNYDQQPENKNSIATFNQERIKLCLKIKDLTFNYETKQKFVDDVLNWFSTNRNYTTTLSKRKNSEDPEYLRRLITDYAGDYFDMQSKLTHETEVDKDARDKQKKTDFAKNWRSR